MNLAVLPIPKAGVFGLSEMKFIRCSSITWEIYCASVTNTVQLIALDVNDIYTVIICTRDDVN